MYTPAKACWLPAEKGKGLEIWGTFSRRNGQISMDLTFTNKAMQVILKIHYFIYCSSKNNYDLF